MAFGVEDLFIESSLEKRAGNNAGNILHLDAFVSFFGEFPQYKSYYKLEDVTALGEIYVVGRDEVDWKSFYDRLVQVRREKNMQRTAGGIQHKMYADPTRAGRDQFTPLHSFS